MDGCGGEGIAELAGPKGTAANLTLTRVLAKPSAAKAAGSKKRRAAPAATGSATAAQVNLGHIFALRPRAQVGFNPASLREAIRVLAEGQYASLDEAVRPVAAKAVELSNLRSSRAPFHGRSAR